MKRLYETKVDNELETLKKKYDKSKQDYHIMKRLYETKVDNEIELNSKKAILERKNCKIEHLNSFDLLKDLDNTDSCHSRLSKQTKFIILIPPTAVAKLL